MFVVIWIFGWLAGSSLVVIKTPEDELDEEAITDTHTHTHTHTVALVLSAITTPTTKTTRAFCRFDIITCFVHFSLSLSFPLG